MDILSFLAGLIVGAVVIIVAMRFWAWLTWRDDEADRVEDWDL